jgi:hypothetical protein
MSNGEPYGQAAPPGLHHVNPLTAAHYDQIMAAERTIHDLLPQLDKAQSCNVPGCDQIRENLRRWQSQLSNIKQTYFPNGRPT